MVGWVEARRPRNVGADALVERELRRREARVLDQRLGLVRPAEEHRAALGLEEASTSPGSNTSVATTAAPRASVASATATNPALKKNGR